MSDDAYVPRVRLDKPSLANWFNETDVWWFDNVRFNAERFERQNVRAFVAERRQSELLFRVCRLRPNR